MVSGALDRLDPRGIVSAVSRPYFSESSFALLAERDSSGLGVSDETPFE